MMGKTWEELADDIKALSEAYGKHIDKEEERHKKKEEEIKETHLHKCQRVVNNSNISNIRTNYERCEELASKLKKNRNKTGKMVRKVAGALSDKKRMTSEGAKHNYGGITIRDGTIYRYHTSNELSLKKIVRGKGKIIDMYSEDNNRKLLSEIINKAKGVYNIFNEYCKIWERKVDTENIQAIILKAKTQTKLKLDCKGREHKTLPSIDGDATEIDPTHIFDWDFRLNRDAEAFVQLAEVGDEVEDALREWRGELQRALERQQEYMREVARLGSTYLVSDWL